SIEKTLEILSPFSGAREHIKTALKMLSDRENPDYRNSIKESISAVEAIVNLINGTDSDTLGKALQKEKFALHGSLKDAFVEMYGYTSDAEGIRHFMLEESSIEFVDAKYMLVSCSAFVNYLMQKFYTIN
ncbi:MAG: hypothetical protein WC774_06035, partial [Candidatus Gracilibacteria bacterium]